MIGWPFSEVAARLLALRLTDSPMGTSVGVFHASIDLVTYLVMLHVLYFMVVE